MSDDLFISEQNRKSGRWVVLEDDGVSAWMYLTEPKTEKPVADCWIYNSIVVTGSIEDYMSRGIAPPAPSEFTGPSAQKAVTDKMALRFEWSGDGESVALFINDVLMGYIVSEKQKGYSQNLVRACPWGNPLDEELYRKAFR